MDRLEDKVCVHDTEAEMYREGVVDAINKINDKKFLRRIYIIVKDYIEERPE